MKGHMIVWQNNGAFRGLQGWNPHQPWELGPGKTSRVPGKSELKE